MREKIINAVDLLSPERFDLFAKLYYAKNRHDEKAKAKQVYYEHIKAFNPSLKEPGREDKNGYEDFVQTFDTLIDNFSRNDFDNKISLVPITEDNVILDGAHRIAALACFNKKVNVVVCEGVQPKARFDYQYFKNRGLAWNTMDIIANEMVKDIPNIYVACLWPKMKEKSQAISTLKSEFPIAYEKNISCNLTDFKQLISIIYAGQPWVNEPESVNDKALQCFDFKGDIHFVFFTSDSLENVLSIKERIRNLYGQGKHTLHITDNAIETQVIAKNILIEEIRKNWKSSSSAQTLMERIAEHWYYFYKVQLLNWKIKIAKLVGKS
ncbi:MAG: hypothetical protein GX567_14525 [Clostridia bacterium]|nr:hypothetical protein [Clostridia bacterium]